MADDIAQSVKQQADIVRVVGEYLKLRKTGAKNWTGLCPFHKEKSGSFSVNAVDGYYYCFGCHETGDVFTFVMKMDSLSFPEAVRAVAVKCNIPLPQREWNSPEEAREADRDKDPAKRGRGHKRERERHDDDGGADGTESGKAFHGRNPRTSASGEASP